MTTMDDMRTRGADAESGQGDCLLLWILVWSELAAFGALLIASW
jgi:nitric oxide reductase NorE protein